MKKLMAIFALVFLISEQQSMAASAPPCKDGATQKCGTELGECSIGKQTCVNGGWSDCDGRKPKEEICDTLDNDCDGLIDEGCECVIESTRPCCTDTNVRMAGTQVCVNGAWFDRCIGASKPSEELCDGFDNNCNGVADEGCLCRNGETIVCGVETGECVIGTQTCVNWEWSDCNGVMPETEVCDGADNDCDGDVDEYLLNACGLCGPVPAEVCDGVDNDCDGDVDEGLLNACGTCGPLGEACDGIDNDCDGQTDEGCPSP
ncbi:MAG: MopE-related protein [Patescibacteria group bacterium]